MENLFINYYESISVILFGLGFSILLLHRNLIRKIIGMNNIHMGNDFYANPLPGGLVLTGIVVSVCMTAFALTLTQKYYEKYKTLDLDLSTLNKRS